jgi:hypothetical protein
MIFRKFEHGGKPERLDLRSLGSVVRKQDDPPALRRDKTPNAIESAVALDAEHRAHEKRLAHIKSMGWTLTEEGWVLNQDDPRWHKQARILIPYSYDVTFEEGIRCAYGRQKLLEAEALADEAASRGRPMMTFAAQQEQVS